MASEFTDLPSASKEHGIHGFYIVPKVGCYKGVAFSSWLEKNLVLPNSNITFIVFGSDEDQSLKLWD